MPAYKYQGPMGTIESLMKAGVRFGSAFTSGPVGTGAVQVFRSVFDVTHQTQPMTTITAANVSTVSSASKEQALKSKVKSYINKTSSRFAELDPPKYLTGNALLGPREFLTMSQKRHTR